MPEQGLQGLNTGATILSNEGSVSTETRQKNQDQLGNTAIQERMKQSQLDSGSANIIASSGNTEVSYDGSFTPYFIKQMEAYGDISKAIQASESMEQENFVEEEKANGDVALTEDTTHITTAGFGEEDLLEELSFSGEKQAVVIGNSEYPHHDNLPKVQSDVLRMSSALEMQNYNTDIQLNQTSDEMRTLWGGLINNSNEGDQIAIYFSGHGLEEGVLGIEDSYSNDDIFRKGEFNSLVQTATGQGVQIDIIIDACHSGSIAEEIRENHASLILQPDGFEIDTLFLIHMIENYKKDLIVEIDYCLNDLLPSFQNSFSDNQRILTEMKKDTSSEDVWFEQSENLQFELDNFLSTYQELDLNFVIKEPPLIIERKLLDDQDDYLVAQVDYYDELMNSLLQLLE